jgi:hypothetical protein
MAAALTCDRQRGGQSDGGWQQLRLQSEREWLLARIAEKPDLTLRAVWPELAERGTAASYGAPANRTAPTSLAGGPGGRRIRPD